MTTLRECQQQLHEEAIIESIPDLLIQKGYAGTSMDDVAAQLGIGKATLYRHFNSKEELALRIIVKQVEDAEDHLKALDQRLPVMIGLHKRAFDWLFPHDNPLKQGIVGAQTKGQFHMIYGTEGTQALFTGLATQIVYGGCDHDTADFYSKASGTTTADANPDPQKANFRQRPLLTVDEVVTPQIGNCTIFARFVEPAFATQVILTARLTRLYEREDWQTRFAGSKNEEPLLLERGVSVNVQPTFTQTEPPKLPKKDNPDTFAQAAKQRMAEAKAGKAKPDDGQPTMTDIRTMKRRAQQQRQTAKAQMEGEDVSRQE